jgi:hypothetical protein
MLCESILFELTVGLPDVLFPGSCPLGVMEAGKFILKVALHVFELVAELKTDGWVEEEVPSQGILLKVISMRMGRYSASSFLTARKV